METLACCVYVAVAKQLPFMLRQWHNSLDRQTSAMVSRYSVLFDCSVVIIELIFLYKYVVYVCNNLLLYLL